MNNESTFKSMAESRVTDVECVQVGLSPSADVYGSLGEKNSLHDPIVADQSQSMSGGTHSFNALNKTNMASICPEGGRERTADSAGGNLGKLGTKKGDETPTICAEEPPSYKYCLRVIEICGLINSTPLGWVIDERQLYRHRARAARSFQDGRRVNFLKYFAWLAEVRHAKIDIKYDPAPQHGGISPAKILKLINQQRRLCALTGRALQPDEAALDHVLPMSRNGTNTIENAQVLHKDVNRAKGALTNDEFVALCREVAAWADKAKTRADGANGRNRTQTQTKGST